MWDVRKLCWPHCSVYDVSFYVFIRLGVFPLSAWRIMDGKGMRTNKRSIGRVRKKEWVESRG